MKRERSLATIVAVVAITLSGSGPAAGLPPPPLLGNGDFEGAFGASGVASGWSTWASGWSETIGFGRETSVVQAGSASQRWGRADGGRLHGGVCQAFATTPGASYTVSAFFRFSSKDPGAWIEGGIDLTGQIADGEATTVAYTKLESGGQNTWLDYTKTFTATAKTTAFFAKFGHATSVSGPCWGYVDSVVATANAPAAPLPDLIVESVSVDGAIVAGQPIHVRCTVKNVGTAATPAGVVIGVGFSIDRGGSSWGVVPGPLAAGQSVVITQNGPVLTAPSAAGSYLLHALVDDVNRIAESNESNNALATTITIGATPGTAPTVSKGSKIGIHAIVPNVTAGLVQKAVAAGVTWPVVKSVDNAGLLVQVRALSPKTLTIFRAVNTAEDAAQGVETWTVQDMQTHARAALDHVRLRLVAPEEKAAVDFLEPLNEAAPHGAVAWRAFGLYLSELVRQADALGLKVALPAFNAGTPEWDESLAFVDTGLFGLMKAGGHILTIHEGVFGTDAVTKGFGDVIPGAPVVSGAGSLCCRYRYLYSILTQRDQVVPLVVSEWYGGGGYGATAAEHLARFKWYDAQVRQDPYVLAFLGFTCDPDPGWNGASYNGFYTSPELAAYLASEKDVPDASATPPAPPLPDLVIESVSEDGAQHAGTPLKLTALVKNQGVAPTPSGVVIGVGYSIGGESTWGVVAGPLAPGATIAIPITGPVVVARSGTTSVTATVDDVDRMQEVSKANNTLRTTIVVP